jgi:hypothetical protein
MTILAYRDGVLAADSACTDRGIHIGTVRKLGRAQDGSVFGAAGRIGHCKRFLDWAEAGMEGALDIKENEDEGFSGLVIRPDRTVWCVDTSGAMTQLHTAFAADGGAMKLALGAMAAGATAVEAVSIACGLDTDCRGPVQVEHVGLAPAPDMLPKPARLDGYKQASAMCRQAAANMEAGRTPAMSGPEALKLMAITFERAGEDIPEDDAGP